MKSEVLDKIKTFFKNNFKQILFCIIFALVCFISTQDNQYLNYILKKGVVLEYSLDNKSTIDENSIEKKLIEQGIKFSFIKSLKNENSTSLDVDNKPITSILHIGLTVLPKEKNSHLFNNISDYIFDNYPNSKLLNIKTLHGFYHKPFNSFINFLGLLLTSTFVWLIVLYLISNDKKLYSNLKNDIKTFFNAKKEAFINYIKKIKARGFGYFIKSILFEEVKDENGNEKETDVTKELISTILFVLICVIVIRYFIGELRWIPSGSMRLTILERDRVFVEKLDFPKKEIKRGDILVFYPPDVKLKNTPWAIFSRLSGVACKDIAYIKRVIGMPNDKFEVKYNPKSDEFKVYINNKALNEPYIVSKQGWTPCNSKMHCGPFVIPENQYFMMGDNRGNSQDSRFWGTLDKSRIIGRANFMFWPISRINILKDSYLELHSKKEKNNYINNTYIVNRYEFLYKIWHAKLFYSLINILGWLRVYK